MTNSTSSATPEAKRSRFGEADILTIGMVLGLTLLDRPWATRTWQAQEGIGAALLACLILPIAFGVHAKSWITLAGLVAGFAVARATGGAKPCECLIACLAIFALRRCTSAPEPRAAMYAVALKAVLDLLGTGKLPATWFNRVAVEMRSATQFVSGGADGVRLGPTYSGFWLATAMCGGCFLVLAERRQWVLGCWLAPLVLAGSAIASGLIPLLHRLLPDLQTLVHVVPIVASVAVAAVSFAIIRKSAEPAPRNPRNMAMLVAAPFLTMLVFVTGRLAEQPRGCDAIRVAALNVGLQDWSVSHDGAYGSFSGGMFGSLPDAIGELGGKLDLINTDGLTDLAKYDVLMLINLNAELPPQSILNIDNFVRCGGTCIVLADHTDVAGLMGPINAVIKRHGISIRFDSAKDFGDWNRSFSTSAAAWLAGAESPQYFPYCIGASLEVSDDATPLLTLQRGFGDLGVRSNYVGAYLGNYRVDRMEEIGDLVVVAESEFGVGKFVVFGDTTPFQNASLGMAEVGFLPRLLAECADKNPSNWSLPCALVIGVAVLIIALREVSMAMLIACAAGTAATGAMWYLTPRCDFSLIQRNGSRPLCVDIVNLPNDAAPEIPSWKSTWSISSSAVRAGFHVVYSDRISDCVLDKAAVVLFVLPLRTVPDAENLLPYVRRGGTVFFVGGPQHAIAISSFLRGVGIEIDNACVGSFPQSSDMLAPSFPAAYAIRYSGAESSIDKLVSRGSMTVAACFHVGRGRIAVFADESLPYGSYVEGDSTWSIGNLALLARTWRLLLDQQQR